jgi:uncharacterized protein
MSDLEDAVRRLSPRAECILVLAIAFGLPVLGSLASVEIIFSNHTTASGTLPHISEEGVIRTLGFEAVVVVLLAWILGVRGWTLDRVGFRPSWRGTVLGVGVALAVQLVLLLTAALTSVSPVGPLAAEHSVHLVDQGFHLGPIIAMSVLNPIYEELFVCGYLITVLTPARGIWFAANASIGLRLVYHLYQGPLSVVFILPLGILFAAWFARTRQLWPLVVAHGVFDAAGMLARQ